MHTIICGNHKYCAQLYFFHLVFTGLVHIFLVCTKLFLNVIFEFPRIPLSSEINELSRWLLSIGIVLIFITYTLTYILTHCFSQSLPLYVHWYSFQGCSKKIQRKKKQICIFTWKTGGFSDGSKCVGAIISNMVHGRKNKK